MAIKMPAYLGAAVMLESMTQAIRHIACIVPAGLGVQEAGLVVFGWQWVEGRRLRRVSSP